MEATNEEIFAYKRFHSLCVSLCTMHVIWHPLLWFVGVLLYCVIFYRMKSCRSRFGRLLHKVFLNRIRFNCERMTWIWRVHIPICWWSKVVFTHSSNVEILESNDLWNEKKKKIVDKNYGHYDYHSGIKSYNINSLALGSPYPFFSDVWGHHCCIVVVAQLRLIVMWECLVIFFNSRLNRNIKNS